MVYGVYVSVYVVVNMSVCILCGMYMLIWCVVVYECMCGIYISVCICVFVHVCMVCSMSVCVCMVCL